MRRSHWADCCVLLAPSSWAEWPNYSGFEKERKGEGRKGGGRGLLMAPVAGEEMELRRRETWSSAPSLLPLNTICRRSGFHLKVVITLSIKSTVTDRPCLKQRCPAPTTNHRPPARCSKEDGMWSCYTERCPEISWARAHVFSPF